MKSLNLKLRTSRVTAMAACCFFILLATASAQDADSIAETDANAESEILRIVRIQKSGPFCTDSEFVIQINNACRTEITVCTPMDAVVRQWAPQDLQPGKHIIRWDGRDDAGHFVASGVYFLKVQSKHCKKVEALALLQ